MILTDNKLETLTKKEKRCKKRMRRINNRQIDLLSLFEAEFLRIDTDRCFGGILEKWSMVSYEAIAALNKVQQYDALLHGRLGLYREYEGAEAKLERVGEGLATKYHTITAQINNHFISKYHQRNNDN